MSWRNGLFASIGARIRDDERGFSLLETVIAITIIFGSLITLAMSASTGFRYVGIGRERQAANQIANQLMEQSRGLAFTKIAQGMQFTDLSTDPEVVADAECGGTDPDVYWFPACEADGGERVVWTNFDCEARPTDCHEPLVPNFGTIGASEDYPVDYEWRTYVTRDCTSSTETCTAPYKVTVLVEWVGAGTSADGIQRVMTESLFHSPRGCVSHQTHPFSAPCQPYFYGQALSPVGRVTVSGTVAGVDFEQAVISLTGADSTAQIEQISSVQGSWTQSGIELTTSAGTIVEPLDPVSGATAADSDPSGTTPGYANTDLPSDDGAGLGGLEFAGAGALAMSVQSTAGDTGQAISATQAGGSDVCPPDPVAMDEIDLEPCGGAYTRQSGSGRIRGHFDEGGFATALGDVMFVSVDAPSTDTTTFANRVLVPDQAGNVQSTANRAFGTISIGGLPEFVTPPAGWLGHFVQLSSYRDVVQSTAGTQAAAPTATIASGTLSCWNGTGYTSFDLATTSDYSVSGILLDHEVVTGDGHTVRIRIAPLDGTAIEMESTPTVSSSPAGSGSIERTEAEATIGSPILGTFDYEIWVDGGQVVDLTIDVSLGTLTTKSRYEPAPSVGS